MKNNNYKPIVSLKKGFELRKKIFFNRASAVFPIFITKKNDFFIVFFNYWKNKNKIDSDRISLVINIYDENGNLIKRDEKKINEFHNQFSIKEILEKKYTKNFLGSVNIEILSLVKLGFPFPAIIGVYKSNNLYSSVHSAGRIKGANERHDINYTDETNWSCKFKKGITPFFHYFKGPTEPRLKKIKVSLLSQDKKIKKIKQIDVSGIKPFGSKIFFIKDIFKKVKFSNLDFISVKVEHNSIFPRLVVGNFHKKKKFFEVTHSFSTIYHKDYCPLIREKPVQSKLSGYRIKDLNLDLKVFPTNCPGSFKAIPFIKRFNQKKLLPSNEIIKFSQQDSFKTKIFSVKHDDQFLSLKMFGKKIPSRFNASFIYKVKDKKTEYSVDIADGARSCVTPAKTSHWGHGYIGEKYETIVLIINDNYQINNHETAEGELNIYSSNFKDKRKIKIEGDSITAVKISDFDKSKKLSKKTNFFSWFLKMNRPGCEAFWLSYRKSDGAIFGDHSF